MPKKPRERPPSQQQHRSQGDPKRSDTKERDLAVGEGGMIETPAPPNDVSRDD
jgi:hypothetical protein